MNLICKECGIEIIENIVICEVCGSDLSEQYEGEVKEDLVKVRLFNGKSYTTKSPYGKPRTKAKRVM